MNLSFRKASVEDIDTLAAIRIEVLKAANQLSDNADLSEAEAETRNYYEESFRSGGQATVLVYDGGEFAGCGSVCFYRVMPTCCNPTGKSAYIMNLYTRPAYRRRGIARKTLRLLVEEAHGKGVRRITLEATAQGRPLYEKFGFIPMQHEMELPVSAD